ncbi:class I SAM-dependent methyltransferase [Sorangium atrum]|uniref:Class I SAM-dependent methyltransferase n=1 Tax=Sorangium atrum TaxID=2995308 RepID=A0ABT5CE33_9BACT|nr:class I SAM-dependent methyltransferase [Sorangium aterium]MDC0684709.1 class I SAM-dependent methyltransferase [Sorangium aterium]
MATKRPAHVSGSGQRRDPELEAGTSAHYEDPAYYAKTYARRKDDVRYYVDLAIASAGPVLEYGCGNGRITLPVARAGVQITGVDLSAPMLGDLRAQLGREPRDVSSRVSLRRGDMRALRLGRRFPLVICPFNAFLHLYTRVDVERFLARAREHLTPKGELVFDVSMPEPAELARDPDRAYATPRFRYPAKDGPGEFVRYTERFDYDKVRQILFVSMEFSPVDGGERWMTPLAHRQFYPQELEALLHYNGFEITALRSDFSAEPPDNQTSMLLYHCRPRRSGRARRPGNEGGR